MIKLRINDSSIVTRESALDMMAHIFSRLNLGAHEQSSSSIDQEKALTTDRESLILNYLPCITERAND
jgi:hypothetical protein